ncbi:MAG: hypothetical protein CL946_11980 [Ectothiorhodospiraceae bacterium]|nr:hypothetical protein [Ectothiorhodospiraceae bacterium]
MAAITGRRKFWYGVLGSLLVLIVAAGLVMYYILIRSLPQTEGTAIEPGVQFAVEVYRDEYGVPHILAQTDPDAYFAIGYVHAQDRLWQMDIGRRFGQGRLAEILGPRLLAADKMIRTIGIARIADTLSRNVSPQTSQMLQAYANGVNAYIERNRGRLPIEFDALGYEPEPWTPTHSLIIARLMGWELALSWWADLTMADLVTTVGIEKAVAVFPPQNYGPFDTTKVRKAFDSEDTRLFQETYQNVMAMLRKTGLGGGSNGWAVTGDRSVSGNAILANDPHLQQSQPARWYIMHVVAPGMNVAGVSVAGAPGIVAGHNTKIAWGLTNTMADDIDFYVERINRMDSTYIGIDGVKQMKVSMDSIIVKDSVPVEYYRYETECGPIISFLEDREGRFRREDYEDAVSIRWTGYELSDEILAINLLNRASNRDQFESALESFGSPVITFVYADTSGIVGRRSAGLIPIRPKEYGMLPASADDAAARWKGFIPFDQLPGSFQDTGYVAAANTAPEPLPPYYIGAIWEDESRYRRISELLREQPSFIAADFELMHMDHISLYADTLRDMFVQALRTDPTRSLDGTWLMNSLANWDLRMSPNSVPACVFNVTYQKLMEQTFRDEMGDELFDRYVSLANVPTRVLKALVIDTTDSIWFDNVETRGRESKIGMIRRSLRIAIQELRERLGSDMSQWKWGRLHSITFEHPFGMVEPLDKVFNVGPLTIGGTNTTINNTEYNFREPYDARVTASMRFIVDMGATDSCYIILTTGQSGQPLSDHYADQAGLWQNGAYHTLITNPEHIRGRPWQRLLLQPAQ